MRNARLRGSKLDADPPLYGVKIPRRITRGLMRRRIASINDLPIRENDRLHHWPLGPRPDDHPPLTDLGL